MVAHQRQLRKAVSYRPITRYEVTGGYLNLGGLQIQNLDRQAPAEGHP